MRLLFNMLIRRNVLKHCSLIISLFYSITSLAQDPDASFAANDPVCAEENAVITNTSVNGDSYVWDFCFEDLSITPTVTEAGSIAGSNLFNSLTLIYDLGKWYGFGTNQGNNKLLRFDYGTSLENIPAEVDLGDLGILDLPRSLELAKEGNNWYGLLVNISGSKVLRLSFGGSLENIPTIEDLGGFNSLSSPYDLKIVNSGSTYYVFITNFGGDDITILDFGGTITNTPSTPADVLEIGSIAGFVQPLGLDIIKDGGTWYGVLAAYGSGKVFKMDFGVDLFSEPVFSEIGSVSLGSEVSIKKEGQDFIGHALGRSSGLYKYEFGTTMGNTPVETALGDFGFLTDVRSMSVVKQSPEWWGYIGHFTNGKLYRLEFSGDCGDVSKNSAGEANPTDVIYSIPGDKLIELTAFSTNWNKDTASQILTVTTSTAPDIDFTTSNFCLDGPNNFFGSSSSTITSYTWDFGDGSPTSSLQSPSYQYAMAGTYSVRLTVVSDNGCTNYVQKDISIYNPPVPSFTVPGGLLCSNNPILFTNTSTVDAGAPVTYEWDFGDGSTSSGISPIYSYSSEGNYTVVLKTVLPDCMDTFQQMLSVSEGAATDFLFANSCNGEPIQFTDLTTGISPITSWSWDFGDGSPVSTEQSPMYSFATFGSFQVTLTTTNQIGCSTFKTYQVSNGAYPVPSFSNQLACHNSETQFTDMSTVQNDNINTWEWDFGDPQALDGTTSSERSPSHVFSQPGSFDVKLKVTSSLGCADSLTQQIQVIESPVADFSWDKSCLGEDTQFLDESIPASTDPISTKLWIINGQQFTSDNPAYTFPDSAVYPVSLTVTGTNTCISSRMDTVTVNAEPQADFDYTQACEGQSMTFRDLSQTFKDPIAVRQWVVDGQNESTDSVFSYVPGQSGQILVSLLITSQNGCDNSLSKTISISAKPSASFETNTSIGSFPLSVNFSNKSSNATAFGWTFEGDSLQSSEENPEYVFNAPGTYNVKLISTNTIGCADTTQQTIQVVEPEFDAQLDSIRLVKSNGQVNIMVDITNNGSITLNETNLSFTISLGEQSSVIEPFEAELYAYSNLVYTLNIGLPENYEKTLPFVCVQLTPLDTLISETNLSNNSECVSTKMDPVFFEPFPNPSSDRVSVGISIPEPDDIHVAWLDSKGGVFFVQTVSETKEGYNLISFDAKIYNDGIYFVRLRYRNVERTFRVVINR